MFFNVIGAANEQTDRLIPSGTLTHSAKHNATNTKYYKHKKQQNILGNIDIIIADLK